MEVEENREFPKDFKFFYGGSEIQMGGCLTDLTDWGKALPRILPGPQWFQPGVMEKDVAILAGLGMNAHRSSVELARVHPEEGTTDDHAIRRYQEQVRFQKSLHLESVVTQDHFSRAKYMPDWEDTRIVDYYVNFAALMAAKLPEVNYWETINEPTLLQGQGYVMGRWPPGTKTYNLLRLKRIQDNMRHAMKGMHDAIKQVNPNAKVSFPHYFEYFKPDNPNMPWDRAATWYVNHVLINKILYKAVDDGSIDFISINYYKDALVRANPLRLKATLHDEDKAGLMLKTIPGADIIVPKVPYYSSMGWPVTPFNLYEGLKYLHKRFDLPILITETGIATKDDNLRSLYNIAHLMVVKRAIKDKVKMMGTGFWSAVNCPELLVDDGQDGYEHDFAGIEVDQKVGGLRSERKVRQSARDVGQIARTGVIDLGLLTTGWSEDRREYMYRLEEKLQAA